MADYIQIKNGDSNVFPVSWQEAFNLTIKGSVNTSSGLPTGVTFTGNQVFYALNSDRTIGKIYGVPHFDINSGFTNTTIVIPLNFSVKATGSQYDILVSRAFAFTWTSVTGQINATVNASIRVASDGAVSLVLPGVYNNSGTKTRLFITLPPCIYFFEDFGDIIETD